LNQKRENSISKFILTYREFGECFNEIHEDSKCRAVVLSGSGKIFTAGRIKIPYSLLKIVNRTLLSKLLGLDFRDMGDLLGVLQSEEDLARKCKKFLSLVQRYQSSFSAIEKVWLLVTLNSGSQ